MTVNPSDPASQPATVPTTTSAPTPSRKQVIWENLQTLAIALLLALVVRVFVAEPRYIPSDSMVPTLLMGDRLVIEKVSYRFHSPRRGDIIVFEPPPQLQELGYAPEQVFIKRVVALPGQTVQVRDRKVYVDHQPLEEPYLLEAPNYQWGPYTVPDGAILVMGDNRNNSNDSHVWGFLPQKNIIGRAVLRFWPLERLGLIRG